MTKINFKVKAIEYKNVSHLFKLTDEELSKLAAARIVVDEKPGFPCRISLQEANIGETIIALSYSHHNVNSPYKSSGPIFIRADVTTAQPETNEIPAILTHRLLSIRAYDCDHMMINATITQGEELKKAIQSFFANESILYLHIHNANPGCFNCHVERA